MYLLIFLESIHRQHVDQQMRSLIKEDQNRSNHYQLESNGINFSGVVPSGLHVEVYTPISRSDVRSYLRIVISSERRDNVPQIIDWIFSKASKEVAVQSLEIQVFLYEFCSITRRNEPSYEVLVERIFDVIFSLIN